MADVKSWTQVGAAAVAGSTAEVEVDEVRPDRTRRIRFRLEQSGDGWLITQIEAPKDMPATIPYGTPITAQPEGSKP
jgi:hypothetical protein